jgi:Protein of unknown function, DUF481
LIIPEYASWATSVRKDYDRHMAGGEAPTLAAGGGVGYEFHVQLPRPAPSFTAAILAASIALGAAEARAQIVNVQPLIAGHADADGLSAVVEGSADIRSGNTRLAALSGNGMLELREGRHFAFLLLRGDFSEKAGTPFVNKDLEHLRYRIAAVGPLGIEAFVQHDRDDFRRLALRALAGAGPRLQLTPLGAVDAAIGAALMVEYERLSSGPEADAGTGAVDPRLSTYVYLATAIAPRLKLGETAYFQPRLDRSGDLRVLNEVSLLVSATDHFSVKTSLTSAYDSDPPIGVVPLDSTFKASLQANF